MAWKRSTVRTRPGPPKCFSFGQSNLVIAHSRVRLQPSTQGSDHNKNIPFDLLADWVLLTLILTAAQPCAFGYTDPGSGMLLYQLAGSAFLAVLFYCKRFLGALGI